MSNKDNRCDKVFESASKSTLLTAGPTVCLLISAIVIIILSALQSFTDVNPDSDDDVVESWEELCGGDQMGYLSPFHFQVTSDQGGGSVACQWRPRNTIFRLIMAIIIILVCATSLVVLLSGKFETLWPVFYWVNWFIFVLMFVAFILDCDALNTGTSFCRNDFKIDGVSFLAFEFEYTTADGTVITDTFAIDVDKCRIDPFIWTILADLIASLVAFCAYKISRYYIFDPTERKASIGGFGGKTKKNSTNKKTDDTTTNDGRTSNATTQQLAGDTNNGDRKGSDPFADYHGGYDVSPDNRKDTGGSAYGGSAYGGGGGGMSAYDE